MVAMLIDDVLKRPEFAGVNAPPSTKGEGGPALPAELGAWIDLAVAVSARATHAEDARALIRYLLRPESNKVWQSRGLERFE